MVNNKTSVETFSTHDHGRPSSNTHQGLRKGPSTPSYQIDVGDYLSERFGRSRVSIDDKIFLFRQLYSLSKVGIPIIDALETIKKNNRNKTIMTAINTTIVSLNSGFTLSRAMSMSPNLFSAEMVSMVNVGENTGKLDEIFRQLTEYLELEKKITSSITEALRYPAIVVLFILLAIGVVNYAVVPNFETMFSRLGAELPLPTQLLMFSSQIFVNHGWLMLGVIVLGVVFLKKFQENDQGRMKVDKCLYQIPFFGALYQGVVMTRFFRLLTMMMKEGIPLLKAVSLISESIGNRYLQSKILNLGETIKMGTSFSFAAEQSGIFKPIDIQMITVGESSGELDLLLSELAEYYERETTYDLKRFKERIEPILVVILALMALILALGIFLPLWDLGALSTRR